jgi:pimeloyl-ACP methyl ester carboxylesterase
VLAWGLRGALLGVFVFAAACAHMLAARYGLAGWTQAGAFVAAFLAVPFTITALAFALAWAHRSPAPLGLRVGPLGYVRCLLVETFWFGALYLFVQAFPRLALPREAGQRANERPVVLLLPGFVCNAGVWAGFTRALRGRGYAAFPVTLEPIYGPIDGYAEAVAERVEALYAASGGRPVAIIGHSMGGLVGRAYLRKYGGGRVSRLITLGSPHHGTALAPYGYGRNAREMRRTSEWLGGLKAFEEGGYPAPVTSVYTYHDNIVAPQESSELSGATNVPLGGMGHMTLLFSPRVVEIVARELAADQR